MGVAVGRSRSQYAPAAVDLGFAVNSSVYDQATAAFQDGLLSPEAAQGSRQQPKSLVKPSVAFEGGGGRGGGSSGSGSPSPSGRSALPLPAGATGSPTQGDGDTLRPQPLRKKEALSAALTRMATTTTTTGTAAAALAPQQLAPASTVANSHSVGASPQLLARANQDMDDFGDSKSSQPLSTNVGSAALPKPRFARRELEKNRHVLWLAGAATIAPLATSPSKRYPQHHHDEGDEASFVPAALREGLSSGQQHNPKHSSHSSDQQQSQRQPPRQRFPDINVDIEARRVLVHWVKIARPYLAARKKAEVEERAIRRKEGAQRRRRAGRVDRLIELYMRNEEEVDRLCYADPEQIILTQIELLTRRIDDIATKAKTKQGSGLRRGAGGGGGGGGGNGSWQWRAGLEGDQTGTTNTMGVHGGDGPGNGLPSEVISWQDAFDQALQSRKNWEQRQGRAFQSASLETQSLWREKQSQQKLFVLAAAEPKTEIRGTRAENLPKLSNTELLSQLRAERDKLKAILPRFDAHLRNKEKRKEEHIINEVEALREERRQAMEEQSRRLREEWRRKEEARQEEERLRAEVEEKERQRALALALAEEEEELRREREHEEELQRLQMEAELEAARKQKLDEEAEEQERERQRQQEEEEQLHRLLREAEELGRRQREERRLQEEQERRRLEEQEAEKARNEAEVRRQRELEDRKLQEELEHLERSRREQQEQDETRREAATKMAYMDDLFDNFEKACDQGGMEETLDAAFAELSAATNNGQWTPPGSPPPEAYQPDSPPDSPINRSRKDDWMSRAMAALGEDDDDDDNEEEEDAGGGDEAGAADLELLRFTEAIVDRIDEMHPQ